MEGLSLICAGLGVIEEDENGNRIGYSKGEFCLDNLRDLLRFLRRDDPQTREVFKQICKWKTVGKDLIPIIEYCQDDRSLVLNAVKVLVFLTMPIEPISTDIAQQLEYLWDVKSAITFSNIVPAILSLLEKPLENLDSESFTEDDWKLVQLVLTLFRNLLAIQEISTQQMAGGSATEFLSLRDRFLELLFQENAMDLLLALSQQVCGSCVYFQEDNLLLLETFHYIFMGQEPELIAKICSENSKEDENAKTSLQGLGYIMRDEQEKRKLNRMRNLGSYSQFSGTFTRFTLDGSKTLCQGNPSFKSRDALLKANKNHRGPSKRTVWDQGRLPSTKSKTLRLLYEFIDQFLSGGYNALMESIREDIEKECHAIQNSDVVIFFQVAWFVTSFQYHKFLNTKPSNDVDKSIPIDLHAASMPFRGSICGPIAETLNESMFLVLISKWRFAFDSLKETNDYKLLSAAGSVLKILIRLLDLVLKQSPEDSMEPKTARILLYKLFYDQTEEGMTNSLINMIKLFDTHKQAKSYLADLVETLHVVFRLMENLQTRGALRVSRRYRKKKMKDLVDGSVRKDIPDQHEVTDHGNKQSEDVSNVWKEKSVSHDCNANEEPSQVSGDTEIEAEMENLRSDRSEVEKKVSHEFDQGIDNSSGDEQQAITDEVDFKMHTLVSALSNHNIIKNLCWLLKFYKSNSLSTNHYIICMLRRVCEDLELSPMLYQLSLLITFYDILEEQKSKPCQEHQNIVHFLTNLVRKLLRKMKTRPLLFVEVLLWKTRKECHLISAECMLNELGSLKKDVREGLLDGEIGLSGGQGWVRRSIADALGDDEADFTILHQENGEKDEFLNDTNLKILNSKEGRESAISSTDDDVNTENDIKGGNHVKKVSESLDKRRNSLVLNSDTEKKIRDLYEKYKIHENCHRLIANAIEEEGLKVSPKQVSRTLKLGFKFARKKSMSLSSSFPDQVRDTVNNLEENFSSRKPLHTKKRVRAFSEDQEQRIKDLFEQFKDQKRCSNMIAAALDAEGTISARQVTYKLKQLGLSVSRKKRSDTHFQLRDDVEDSAGSADNSDDEPLISLKRKRSKKLKKAEFAQRENEEIARKMSSDDSEEELPSPDQPNTLASEMDVAEVGHTGLVPETGGISSEKPSDIAPMEGADDKQSQEMHDELGDELADFEDEASVVESQKFVASKSRRHLRMIMDLDDDE